MYMLALHGRWLGFDAQSRENVRGVQNCGLSHGGATRADSEFAFCINLGKEQVVVRVKCVKFWKSFSLLAFP